MKLSRTHLYAVPALLVSLCAACHPSDVAAEAEQGERTRDLPSIHAVLHWEHVMLDKNQAKKDYKFRVTACENAGISTQQLSTSDVERLDTGTIEIMIDSSRQAVRRTAWTFGTDESDESIAGSCRFHLVENRYEELADDDAIFEPIEEKPGFAYPGWVPLGDSTVAGQPCKRWRPGPDAGWPEEICVWSGGRQWGFDDAPLGNTGCFTASAANYFAAIPLQGQPLKGSGCILKVQSFSVGKGSLSASAGAGAGAVGGS